MVREPVVFLFDEPLSNLDAGLRAQMRIEIGAPAAPAGDDDGLRHARPGGGDDARRPDRGARRTAGSSRSAAPIDLYRAPVNRFVAGFIGTPPMNFVDGVVVAENGGAVFVAEGARVKLDQTCTGGTPCLGDAGHPSGRPAAGYGASAVDAPSDVLRGTVVLVERLGGSNHVHFEVGSTARDGVDGERRPASGRRDHLCQGPYRADTSFRRRGTSGSVNRPRRSLMAHRRRQHRRTVPCAVPMPCACLDWIVPVPSLERSWT